jgi:hypothetical protein
MGASGQVHIAFPGNIRPLTGIIRAPAEYPYKPPPCHCLSFLGASGRFTTGGVSAAPGEAAGPGFHSNGLVKIALFLNFSCAPISAGLS